MDEDLRSFTIATEPYNKGAIDSLSEYQRWYMRMKQLIREAEYAKVNGQLKKAQDLFSEVRKITKEFCDKRVSS